MSVLPFPFLVSSRGVRHRDSGKRVAHNPVTSFYDLVAVCGRRISGDATGVGDCGLWTARDVPDHVKPCARCEIAAQKGQ